MGWVFAAIFLAVAFAVVLTVKVTVLLARGLILVAVSLFRAIVSLLR